MNEKIAIVSLGCDKNRVDAERMAFLLEQAGYTLVPAVDGADCAVINTCGFIQSAKEEAIAAIFDAVGRKNGDSPLRAVVVTGCLAQRYCDEITAEIPEVDAVVGLSKNGDIASVVASALAGKGEHCCGSPELLMNEGERLISTPGHYAYIKIAEGCRNHCTYCAIPMIRGGYRSRPVESIVAEAKALAQSGVRELIVIAQDTTAYGCDLGGGVTLASLLRQLCKIEKLNLIRVLYGYPDGITDDLVQVFATEAKLAKYLDMPLQHCSDEVLRRMGRRGNQNELMQTIEKIRASAPVFAVRTTFIAGFPGETQAQCDELCRFIRAARFARSGCFAFSEEEGTPAVKLDKKHGETVKARRAEQVSRACYESMLEFQLARIGNVERAMCDGFDSERGAYVLRGDYDAPDIDTVIYVESEKPLAAGEMYNVRITSMDEPDMKGTLVC